MKKIKGFTLVELMIVCFIISIIAAIAVPNILRAMNKSRKDRNYEVQYNKTHLPPEQQPKAQSRNVPRGAYPTFLSEDITINLSPSHKRIGMDIYTRFEAIVKGRFTIKNQGEKNEPVILDFKFPRETAEANDVSLRLTHNLKTWEPDGVIYDKEGIFWNGILEDNEEYKVEISFTAQGRDRFLYYLPRAFKTNEVRLNLSMQGDPSSFIPDQALQPTSINNGNITWQFNNLVTDMPIIVDLPGKMSPLGRILLLCKLVGMAVLLFGAGFWYLTELYQPGGLYKFRWGHFLLLALTYSLFFIIFAVLGFRGKLSTWENICISALLSMPLLLLHVSRIIDFKFALFRIMPLAVFTLALVINGVYGGEMKDYIFVGAIFIIIAFITVTFRKWSENREKWGLIIDEKINDRINEIENSINDARTLNTKAMEILKEPFISNLTEHKTDLENKQKKILSHLNDFDSIKAEQSKLRGKKTFSEKNPIRNSLNERLYCIELLLPGDKTSFDLVIDHIKQLHEAALSRESISIAEKSHCQACGFACEKTPFCPNCGAKRPKTIKCSKCSETTIIPLHLLDGSHIKDRIYCLSCGESLHND